VETLLHLLLVDDDALVLQAQQRIFSKYFHLLKAENYDQAWTILQTRHVDIVLSDYDMPGKNGGMLLQAIKQTYPHIRRFLNSGSSPRDLPNLLASGVAEKFFEKPTIVNDFVQVLGLPV